MGKAPDAFRTISEVADWLGVQTHVLRFWESKFTQVKPLKRAGGRRYYRPADMELLGGLRKLLHEDGLTIKGAQKFIREHGVKAVADLSPPVDEPVGGAPAVAHASGAEAAAAMAPESGAEVHVHQAEAEPDVFEGAVHMEGEEPAPAAAVHIHRDGPDEAVDMTGEEPAPAAEVQPDVFESAVSMEGEEPAPAAEVFVLSQDSDVAADVSPEELPAPEQKANLFRDAPGDEEDVSLPSFIRKPMAERETTVPPVSPGPPPLAEHDEPRDDARFAGVGAARMPDLDQQAAGTDEAPAPEHAPFPADPAPPVARPLSGEGLDAGTLRPLYERLLALRARMG